MNDGINSLEKRNSLMNNKEFKVKILSKKNFLRKYFTSKSVDISKIFKISNEEFKIENEDINISKSFVKKTIVNIPKKNEEKKDISNYFLDKQKVDKKVYNNFILKAEFNPKYNNINIKDYNKFNLLYNYFGNENEKLKNNLKKNEKFKYKKIKQESKQKIQNENFSNQEKETINNFFIYNNNIINYPNDLQNELIQKKYLHNLYNNNQSIDLNNATLYIKDQIGCRLLQNIIDNNPKISNILFTLLLSNIERMCTDLFGNYVIQKLIVYLNSQNFEKFTLIISKQFKHIASSTYGTRVIQKLIEIISNKNQNFINEKEQSPIFLKCFSILNSLIINDLVDINKDNNSYHIIIKFVSEIPYPANDNMYNSIYKNFLMLCKNKHGCCVIQKCFEFGNVQQKNILFSFTNKFCSELICDQFGNYVIQYVVKCNNEIVNNKLLLIIMNNLLFLCKEKYASNVLEKFIFYNSKESKIFLNKIINDVNIIYELITDQYGNYIIQRVLSTIDIQERIQMFKLILGWLEEIKNLSFGSRLLSKLFERYKEFNIMINNFYSNEIKNNNNDNIYKYMNIHNKNISSINNFENLNNFLMNKYLISSYYINSTNINSVKNQLINVNKQINEKYNAYYQINLNNYFDNNQNYNNNDLNKHF